jgi:oligoribonuclease (3'-5' exoribonuclease)
MTTITFTFPPVKRRAVKHGHCPVCGESVTRTRTFTHYEGPFHPAVEPDMSGAETHAAVVDAVMQEAHDWQPDFTHEKCKEQKQ